MENTRNTGTFSRPEYYRIIREMERKRNITSYFAGIRARVIGGALPTITVTTDENGNVRRIDSHYSPAIEGILHELEEMERKQLEDVKSVNLLGW